MLAKAATLFPVAPCWFRARLLPRIGTIGTVPLNTSASDTRRVARSRVPRRHTLWEERGGMFSLAEACLHQTWISCARPHFHTHSRATQRIDGMVVVDDGEGCLLAFVWCCEGHAVSIKHIIYFFVLILGVCSSPSLSLLHCFIISSLMFTLFGQKIILYSVVYRK